MTEQPDIPAESLADKELEIARLQAEIVRSKVSRESGVPMEFLGDVTTEEQARAAADQALAWRGETPPTKPTAAVSPYQPGQISQPLLSQLSPADTMASYRQGRLEGMGAPAPPPRRSGEQHRNAAP